MLRKIRLAAAIIFSFALLTACGKSENAPTGKQVEVKDGEVGISFLGDEIKLSSSSGVTAKNGVVTITETGTYRVGGSASSGQIVVDADKDAEVILILDNLNLTCENSSAVYVEKAKNTIIRLEDDTENVLTDGDKYSGQVEEEPDACIFSKDDLQLDGKGILTVNGNYAKGIHGKDTLVLTADNLVVNAKTDGISGKDRLTLQSGNVKVEAEEKGLLSSGVFACSSGAVTITTPGDALHSNGDIVIDEGEFTLEAGDDGVHADNVLIINGGTMDIPQCNEGLEAKIITVNGGNISLVSDDDGLNAAGSGSSDVGQNRGMKAGTDDFAEEKNADDGAAAADNQKDLWDREDIATLDGTCAIYINGGKLDINAEGDGMDSNGDMVITGGDITVNGPASSGNAALDYSGKFLMEGGTLIAAGQNGMAQSVGDESKQCAIAMSFSEMISQGTKIALKNQDNEEVLSYTTLKEVNHMVFSSSEIKEGNTYTICVNDEEMVSQKISKISTWLDENGETEAQSGMRGGHGGMKGGDGSGRPWSGTDGDISGDKPFGGGRKPGMREEMPEGGENAPDAGQPLDDTPSQVTCETLL